MPQFLAITGQRNWSRYVFISNGLDHYIDDHHPGGFEGWLREAEETEPELVVVETGTVFVPPQHTYPTVYWAKQAAVLRDFLTRLYTYQPAFSTEYVSVYLRTDILQNP